MAAGGFREFVAGEVLDEDDINDFLMQGILVFAGTAARGSAIPSPVEGQFSFRTDDDVLEFYDGSGWVALETAAPEFEYLVIAGGGGGATAGDNGGHGGGGAGGYRCNVSGENSGGGFPAEPKMFLPSTPFTVTVGAGGSSANPGATGSDSVFAHITSKGGGGGGTSTATAPNGGSGGGGSARNSGGSGAGQSGGNALIVPDAQGFAGGAGFRNNDLPNIGNAGGGGGGSGAVGNNAGNVSPAAGGAGVSSSITGSGVFRGGGGGGSGPSGGSASGGNGGGGAGGSAGTVNTGGGGGGNANGGSGVVIAKYPDTITLSIGGGLTSSTTSAGGFKITTFTAGTDTVSF